MLDNLKADTRRLKVWKSRKAPWYVLESLLFENGYQAVVLHRIAHWFKRRGIPFFGPFFARLSLFLTGVDISPGAEIGPGLLISHGVGLVIGGHARIGANALLLHQVTIGSPEVGRLEEMPTLGDDVFVGAGATLIGDIQVGDGARIDAMVLVSRDVPAGHRVAYRSAIEIQPLPSPPPEPSEES
ncbi:MAG: serine acetyltransferase [Acidobacteria bacterium]|nr:serine acetyltransferase [Acidobacteriota bacterium]